MPAHPHIFYSETMMRGRAQSSPDLSESSPYEIVIHGELDGRWSEWFNGTTITVNHSRGPLPLTTLHFPAIDQAKLRGVLNKIWDMNLTLESVHQVSTQASDKGTMDGRPFPV